jgi:hypothetical protein
MDGKIDIAGVLREKIQPVKLKPTHHAYLDHQKCVSVIGFEAIQAKPSFGLDLLLLNNCEVKIQPKMATWQPTAAVTHGKRKRDSAPTS